MSATKHTPGPWAISAAARCGNELMIVAPSSDGSIHVCEVTTNGKSNNKKIMPEQEANARAIAALPELLAACRLFVEYDNDTELDNDITILAYNVARSAIRAAIAKAEGRTV
jgi:hypothetical protein